MTSLQIGFIILSTLGGVGVMLAIIQPDISRLRTSFILMLGIGGFFLCLSGIGSYFYFQPGPPPSVVERTTGTIHGAYEKSRDVLNGATEVTKRKIDDWREAVFGDSKKKEEKPKGDTHAPRR